MLIEKVLIIVSIREHEMLVDYSYNIKENRNKYFVKYASQKCHDNIIIY